MMTRRSVLAMLATLPGFAFVARQQTECVGPMTLDRERVLAARCIKVRVLVDGVDVTNRCQYADDTPGRQVARLLKRDRDGRCFLDPVSREVARETVTSDVEIRLERRA